MSKYPSLLEMTNKKPALQGSMMNVFLSLMPGISSSHRSPSVFQDKVDLWRTCHQRKSWRDISSSAVTKLLRLQHRQRKLLCRGAWRKNKHQFFNSRTENKRFFSSFHRIQTTLHATGLLSRIPIYLKLCIYMMTGNNISNESRFILWKMYFKKNCVHNQKHC